MKSQIFSTDLFAAGDRHEAWRARDWPSLAPVTDTPTPSGPFYAHCQTYMLGPLALTYTSITGQTYERPKAFIRRDGIDHIGLCLMMDGNYSGETSSGDFSGGAGTLLIGDLGRVYAQESTDARTATMMIPRGLARTHLPILEGMHGQVMSASEAAYLTDHLQTLQRHLPTLPDGAGYRLSMGIIQALAVCLEARSESVAETVFASEKDRVQWYIDRHLADPDLNVERLASLTGVARSQLYRLFADSDGIASHIRRCRLERAQAMLSDLQNRDTISTIAKATGFREPAQFSRAFRAYFGVSPSEMRPTAR